MVKPTPKLISFYIQLKTALTTVQHGLQKTDKSIRSNSACVEELSVIDFYIHWFSIEEKRWHELQMNDVS